MKMIKLFCWCSLRTWLRKNKHSFMPLCFISSFMPQIFDSYSWRKLKRREERRRRKIIWIKSNNSQLRELSATYSPGGNILWPDIPQAAKGCFFLICQFHCLCMFFPKILIRFQKLRYHTTHRSIFFTQAFKWKWYSYLRTCAHTQYSVLQIHACEWEIQTVRYSSSDPSLLCLAVEETRAWAVCVMLL